MDRERGPPVARWWSRDRLRDRRHRREGAQAAIRGTADAGASDTRGGGSRGDAGRATSRRASRWHRDRAYQTAQSDPREVRPVLSATPTTATWRPAWLDDVPDQRHPDGTWQASRTRSPSEVL